MAYPKMVRIRQIFERPRVEDIPGTVRAELEALRIGKKIQPGHTVALTAGSRGIANIPLILQSVAGFLKGLGAKPFIVPAMGSHGGGTAEGQKKVLESYGITEEFVGAPIRASMEVVELGRTGEGFPVILDREASLADHIGVVARIKPHPAYHGPIESGLLKMIMIGLGKHVGAIAAHQLLQENPYDLVVRSITRQTRAKSNITFGLGLVENGFDETARIAAVLPEQFEEREEELLVQARQLMARLPFPEADLLIVDEIGKEISGSGMDTNVVGRKSNIRSAGEKTAANVGDAPRIRYIFVRGLTPLTHGNGVGIGLAHFTTNRLIKQMNYEATRINALTGGHPDGAAIPVHFETDREVIDAVLSLAGARPPEKMRFMHIRNTLQLEELEVSESYLQNGNGRPGKLEVIGAPRSLEFDPKGDLASISVKALPFGK